VDCCRWRIPWRGPPAFECRGTRVVRRSRGSLPAHGWARHGATYTTAACSVAVARRLRESPSALNPKQIRLTREEGGRGPRDLLHRDHFLTKRLPRIERTDRITRRKGASVPVLSVISTLYGAHWIEVAWQAHAFGICTILLFSFLRSWKNRVLILLLNKFFNSRGEDLKTTKKTMERQQYLPLTTYCSIHLNLLIESISYLTIFFYNKLINNIFNYDFLDKWMSSVQWQLKIVGQSEKR
jgi:hypothetical protein